MSELTPSIQVLDKGLDLQTAKLLAPPGSLLDSLNYEQVDFQGQKRIEGITRYDGTLLADATAVYLQPNELPSSSEWIDDVLWYGEPSEPIAVRVTTNGRVWLAPFNRKLCAELAAAYGWSTLVDFSAGQASPEEYQYQTLVMVNDSLRARVGQLPGYVSGLHWFRDKLYAVSDLFVVQVSSNEQGYPEANTVLSTSSSGSMEVLHVNNGLLLLSGQNKQRWIDDEVSEVSTGASTWSVVSLDPEIPWGLYQSSLYEALDETNETDAGWKFVHQGWSVPFYQGKSSFGSFPSVNQNLKGVGIQGPTDITGDHGSPEFLTQGINITNAQTQVNGWKSSNNPDTYVLAADNVKRQDTLNVYADAFFSWSEGSIDSPNPNDALVQYSPTASVEVEV